jgi:hypothetical protein
MSLPLRQAAKTKSVPTTWEYIWIDDWFRKANGAFLPFGSRNTRRIAKSSIIATDDTGHFRSNLICVFAFLFVTCFPMRLLAFNAAIEE